MKTTMKYALFVDLLIKHSFYEDGICSDFAIEPLAETRTLLANHRCVFKRTACGFGIIATLDEQGRMILPMAQGLRLSFAMRLLNPNFTLFTDTSALEKLATPFFTNHNASAADAVPLKLVDGPEGGEPLPKGNFAGIALHIDDSLSTPGADAGQTPAHFEIPFKPKQAKWRYYIITNYKNDDILIKNGGASAIAFAQTNRTNLNDAADLEDEVARALAKQFPTQRRWRFISDEAILQQDMPRKALELHVAGEKVILNLPNPPPGNCLLSDKADSAAGSGEGQKELSLFQVINYSSQ